MNPELSPLSWARNGGRPFDIVGFSIRSIRRSEIDPSSARPIFSVSSGIATGSPWKFPFETTSSRSARTSGLSVAAFSSTATARSV